MWQAATDRPAPPSLFFRFPFHVSRMTLSSIEFPPPFYRLDPEHRNCQTFRMTKLFLAIGGLVSAACIGAAAEDHTIRAFKRIQLSDLFWSEGANFGDFNKDGKNDIISGPYWWEGPDFKVRHEYYQTKARTSVGYKAPFTRKNADGTEELI